ncbi:MAG: DUF3037 domain-containing protein [Ignavibacteriales bacterium]|nr:DUF3037 domain-containing protein [Ignavibacteriales bacterium]
MSTIYYSIIRYVPDLFRKEFVNIGAIVVDPSSRLFKYYFADDEQRLKYFYPSFSKDDIVRFKEYIIDLESKKTISFLNYSDAGNTELFSCYKRIPRRNW